MDTDAKATVKVPVAVILASLVIVIAGMKAASSLLVPLFVALFIAVVCISPLFWMQRKGVPRVIAVIIILLVILFLGLAFGALIGPSLNQFLSSLPGYQEQLSDHLTNLISWLRTKGIHISAKDLPRVQPGWVMSFAGGIFSALSSVLTNGFLILLTVVFILLEAEYFPQKLRVLLKNPDRSMHAIEKFALSARRYLIIKTIVSAATGLVIWLWLLILGVDYPVLWGTLAFVLNFVPNIGAVISALPAALLALVQLGVGHALLTILAFITVHIVIGNIIEPKITGKGLNLSTLVVFISLVFWGWVLGPIGMILSVPLTNLLKIALESSEETTRYSVLLGSHEEVKTSVVQSSRAD
ncbi:MAG TPA: AI-2E family transporter [Syntrophorhabdaceae bacterium]|jgi:predicted PurR-regulated permease PerM